MAAAVGDAPEHKQMEEHKKGGKFQRVLTMFSPRRSSTSKPSRSSTMSFPDRLDEITKVCAEILKGIKTEEEEAEQKLENRQHAAIAIWASECSIIFGFEILGIKNPESFQNKDLCERLQTFAPHSSFAKSVAQKAKKAPWESISELIFKDASHPQCSVCEKAQEIRRKVGEEFFEMLHPGRAYVGVLGTLLREQI